MAKNANLRAVNPGMDLAPFNGCLNKNEIFQSIYNMIISQTVFADPIKGDIYGLADKFKKDGTLFGDTKLFYSVQIGSVSDWGNDAEAENLLKLHRPVDPYCQAVVIDVFKKIALTVDNFLSKRAWGEESAFGQFNSVILGTMRQTKKVYEATMVNAFVGTESTSTGKQAVSITIPTDNGTMKDDQATPVTLTLKEKEALNRLKAQAIAKGIADLLVDIKDVSTSYNDLGYLRSYTEDELMFIWNADYYNEITKLDLPTIFHNDGLIAKLGENVIPSRYFGTRNASAVLPAAITANKYRAVKQMDVATGANQAVSHLFAGDYIPAGATKVLTYNSNGTAATVATELAIGEGYEVDDTVICKVCVPESIQYMSAFETQTEFYNPLSLTNNHYLIFGHSDLNKSRLKEFPYITVKAV